MVPLFRTSFFKMHTVLEDLLIFVELLEVIFDLDRNFLLNHLFLFHIHLLKHLICFHIHLLKHLICFHIHLLLFLIFLYFYLCSLLYLLYHLLYFLYRMHIPPYTQNIHILHNRYLFWFFCFFC